MVLFFFVLSNKTILCHTWPVCAHACCLLQPEFALEIDIGGPSSDDVRLTPLPGHTLKPKMAEWTQAQINVRVPPNATSLYVMIRLQGNSTATFLVSGIEFLLLDSAMRNIIRTNATDVKLSALGGSTEYILGEDYSVENPKSTENTAHHLYVDMLEPYNVRRLAGGKIPEGGTVSASFDYLPGKVNQAGHSTPSAFGEPAYYALLENAINHTMQEFRPTLINFDHDEIRGMARDSRSLGTGLTNAELLARDMNRMQSMVQANDPEANALFWDDMVNPFHNGGQCDYQTVSIVLQQCVMLVCMLQLLIQYLHPLY
eukprot:COSAG06_NODE_3391_length_5412_cov_79.977037_5_plen_315_part_00